MVKWATSSSSTCHYTFKWFQFVPAWTPWNTSSHFQTCEYENRLTHNFYSLQAEAVPVHFLRAAKRAAANARRSSCQQAYSTQHKTQLPDFLLRPHRPPRRLHAAFRTRPTPPPRLKMLSSHLIKTCCFSQAVVYFVFPNCKTRRDYLVFWSNAAARTAGIFREWNHNSNLRIRWRAEMDDLTLSIRDEEG